MINLVFNKAGNFLLHSALVAISKECIPHEFNSTKQSHFITGIVVIELANYKSLRELVNYLVRIKLASPATAVLLVISDEQTIPTLGCSTIKISAPVSAWKKTLASLKRNGNNIDSVVRECMSFISHQRLSTKQVSVIDCLGKGMSPGEISKHLFLSVKTVYTYISLASKKYGFSSSKKFHRYVINETEAKVSCAVKFTLRLPLNDHIIW
ncbi:hypothetical protein BJP35_2334 [Enterobacter sp. J49]|uniref:LuxR C-terminal-related transcriptional regulator n=1 Tax=Enterobacter sp. J49 TaxID=1903627 RepID=UPI000B67D8C8|nr:LuxR C-terminal-related transcriptional regulator [Enterobacter sp. J49]OUC37069.1 hypothetical protein BJP35_2334 [Enterobacter sp. J49]